jgi:hypothetical protein
MVVLAQGVTRFSHGEPTVQEQLMLELVNRARANPVAEAARLGIDLNEGLPAGTILPGFRPPLMFEPRLISAARGHSSWMLSAQTFSHAGQGGSTPRQRMEAAGYAFTGSWANGENIAWGGTTGTLDLTAETRELHDGLFRSPDHRENLCAAGFREVGIGVLSGVFDGYNAGMIAQKFAASGSQPLRCVTGVVFVDRNGDGRYDAGEGIPGVRVLPEGGTWDAVTSGSGGFAVPYSGTSGALNVAFSGPGIRTAERRTVTRTGQHVKLDLAVAPFAEIVPGSLAHAAATGFRLGVRGTPGILVRLQWSPALGSWTDVGQLTLSAAGEGVISHRSGTANGFYRLAW